MSELVTEDNLRVWMRARHIKSGGEYRVVALAKLEWDETPVVVYAEYDAVNPKVWVRPVSEFCDGRFERPVVGGPEGE